MFNLKPLFIRRTLFLFTCLFWHINLVANDIPVEITFKQLKEFNQNEISTTETQKELTDLLKNQITIRGFIYELNNGQWILAAMPNIKSCCLDNEKVVGARVNIHWASPPKPTQNATLVKGHLQIHRQINSENLFQLENAEIITNDHFLWLYAFLLFLALAIGIGLFRKP